MQEADKVTSLKEMMNDLRKWVATITYMHLFDMSISTKLVVNC